MPLQYDWTSGEGERKATELNPRGWINIDFSNARDGFDQGLNMSSPSLAIKLQEQYEARKEARKQWSSQAKMPPLCHSIRMDNLPHRITMLSDHFNAVTARTSSLPDDAFFSTFPSALADVPPNCPEWDGGLIWAATARADFLAFSAPWLSTGSSLKPYIPETIYPTASQAGNRAPFVDIGLGSSLGFFWAMDLDWDIQFSAALVTSIAYYTDMASGPDAPVGKLGDIFDVLPALARACTTGYHDNLAPMKALAIEYLRAPSVSAFSGPQPSLEDVWISRIADVGAGEACVLMTGCNASFSPQRSGEDTRFLVSWGVLHDFYDLPRDLSSGNRVNAVFWALFKGASLGEVVQWLRESVALAARKGSCAAKLLLCSAFVHVTNPRWGVNGRALDRVSEWPAAPKLSPRREGLMPDYEDNNSENPCVCKATDASRSLGAAALDALGGSVPRFASLDERMRAHKTGMSALVSEDWGTLVDLSRTAWSTFWFDLDIVSKWADGG